MQAYWLEQGEDATINAAQLQENGYLYQQLPLESDAHQPALNVIKKERGYVAQDIVQLKPNTPNLDAICDKFAEEHLHEDDEVRFVLTGEGIFDLRSKDDRWMRVKVEAGDLLVVPEGSHHRFFLTDSKAIQCVRLFKDSKGWEAIYRT